LADANGRLLAGSTFFDPANDRYARGKLYSIAADGKVSILDDEIKLANGLGFSPDNRILYFTDSADRVIYAYDYDAAAGLVRNRRLFVKVPGTEGLPDGLTVDAEGFVWSAQWFGGCICRYDPDGQLERRIRIPAGQTSSLTFGGPDLTDIFVTTAGTPDALSLAPPAYQASGDAVGGALFRVNLGIQGKEDFRCRVGV
jgi:D-xylonolactonase